MKRKDAARFERELKARGVYKPFVSKDGDILAVESYPLTVYVGAETVDPEQGPFQPLKLSDCSLPREGREPVVREGRLYLGQSAAQIIAAMLLAEFPTAHARALAQDSAWLKDAKAPGLVRLGGIDHVLE